MEGWLEIRKMALAPWAADILNFRFSPSPRHRLSSVLKVNTAFRLAAGTTAEI